MSLLCAIHLAKNKYHFTLHFCKGWPKIYSHFLQKKNDLIHACCIFYTSYQPNSVFSSQLFLCLSLSGGPGDVFRGKVSAGSMSESCDAQRLVLPRVPQPAVTTAGYRASRITSGHLTHVTLSSCLHLVYSCVSGFFCCLSCIGLFVRISSDTHYKEPKIHCLKKYLNRWMWDPVFLLRPVNWETTTQGVHLQDQRWATPVLEERCPAFQFKLHH